MSSNELTLGLRIKVNNDGSVQVLNQTGDGINRISTASGNASRGLRNMDSAASGLMRTLAPLVSIYELISFGDKVINDTATVQDLDTRLHSLTATAGDYAKTLGYINTVADDQHKKLNDLTDSYAKLRVLENSGIITGQQTKGLFEGLNNAASELGAGNDQLKQSFFGLAQGLASGVLHAEELNQVTEPMPGLMNSLDKALGQGAGGFRRLTNDGKITSEMFATTLVKALHDFDGAAAATAQNINAKSTDMSNSWTQLVTSFEPSTKAIFNPIADSAKSAIDATREFNEVAMTVGETNVSASSLAQAAWAVTTDAISNGWGILKAAGLGAASDTVSSWIVSGDQMKSNVKFVVNDMIGLFVGLGHSVGIIFGALAINVGNTLDNAIAKASAAAGDVARMGVGDFSFSSSKAVVNKPLVNGWADAAAQLKIDLSTDYIGTFTEAVKGAAVGYQTLANEQKKAADEAEQAKAKALQLAAAHTVAGSAAGQSAEAAKKAAAEAKKHAEAIIKEVDALNDQHQKLSLSERDYELSKLAALGMTDAVKASSIAVWDSIRAIEAQKKGIDAGESAMDAEIERYNKLTQSANEYKYSQLLLAGVSPGTAVEIVAKSSVSDDIEKRQKSIDDARSSLENYNKTIADTAAKTSDLGSVTSAVFDGALGGINTLAGAFDNMINSIDKSTAALEANQQAKIEIDKFQPATDKGIDQYLKDLKIKQDALTKNAKDELKYNTEIVNEKLSGTRQIAGAVSSMLKQGSTEQRAAHAIEMGLAGAELAMNALKIFGINTVTAAETDSVGPSVTASAIKGEAKAAEAVATQATAGPYIGFALMAAMAAAMAAIGFMGGKSSVASMGPQGMSPDTGTVLGDPSAKSQSIDNTYQLLKDIQAENYPVLKSIDQGISDLHSGITDVITRLFQAGGLAAVTAPASQITGIHGMLNSIDPIGSMGFDPIGQFILGGIFGGKQTSNVTAQGIATSPTSITDIIAGKNLAARQFAQIETKTDGGWFGSDSFSFSTQYAALDAATQKALTDVFKSMGTTMLGLADNLGMGLSDRVNNYIIPALTVDLKGLDGEAAAKKLNGVLSTALDTMSTDVFGDKLGQYQHLGEGMLETTVRIVSEVAVVQDAFRQTSTHFSGDIIAISDALVQASGGITEFQKQLASFTDKFLTDAEKQNNTYLSLMATLSSVNVVLPKTRDEYRRYVETINVGTAAGQAQYTMMLKLADAADGYYKALETGAATAAQTLSDTNAKLASDAEKAVSDSKSALVSAYKSESSALSSVISKTTQFIAQLNGFKDSLNVGDLSPGTNLDKYKAASAQLQAGYNTIVSGPGSTSASQAAYDAAISNIQGKISTYLTASKAYNASGSQYAADYSTAMNIIDSLTGTMSAQKTDSQQQLDQLTKSVGLLVNINDSVLSVTDAVNNLYSALASQAAATRTIGQNTVVYNAINGSHADGLSHVPFDGYIAELHKGERVLTSRQVTNDGQVSQEIVAELRALRKEVEQLRAEQNAQTGALIDSNFAANDMAAEKVIAGADNTAKQTAWVAKSKATVI